MNPMEDPAVGVAVADVVAVVSATSVGGGAATVQIVDVLKDDAKVVTRGDRIQIKGVLSTDEAAKRSFCGVASMAAGKNYIVLLWGPAPGSSSEFYLIDPYGGMKDHGAAEQAAITGSLAKPQPHSGWKASPLGVQARLVVDVERPPTKGEVDLLVVLRNMGKVAVDFKYKDWPEAEQSNCSLQIDNVASKKRIDAREVPIPKKDIADYFTKHSRSYQVKIEPGGSHIFRLPRVTTAVSGWGYKEELGFRYYPVAQPGPHSISAECFNLVGLGTKITTNTLTSNL